MIKKIAIATEVLDRIRSDLDLDDNDFDYKQLQKADDPAKIHEALFTASDIGSQLSTDLLQTIYDDIAVPTTVPKHQWRSFAPFCHGTNEYNSNQIKAEGLKPRLLTGVSQWEESGMASMPDRSYIGINSAAGLEKCIEGMLNASESIPEGDIFFFDLDTVDHDPVADEDCMKINPFMDAFESADQCASFGLRKPVSKERILGHFSFDPYDLKRSADQVCQFLDKGKNNDQYMPYSVCMEIFHDTYNKHSINIWEKGYNRSEGKITHIHDQKFTDLRQWF